MHPIKLINRMRSFFKNFVTTDIIVYIISEALGVYFISTLMLLQTSLPSKYLYNIDKIIGGIDIIKHYQVSLH